VGPRPELAELQRAFKPPPGLGWSRPRDVRLTPAGRVVLGVTTALFLVSLVLGAALFRTAERQATEQGALAQHGLESNAEVVRLWRGSSESKRSMVAYRFAVGSHAYDAQAPISLPRWKALQVGAHVHVRYLPSDPTVNLLDGTAPRVMPLWVPWIIGSAVAGLGVAGLLMLRNQLRLLTDGRPAPAIVTRLIKHRSSHGGTHRSITYDFPLLSGATARGRSVAPRKPPAIGSVICVIYDPERPRTSMLYPLPLVQPAAAPTIHRTAD
jgi:hypothetical protein